MCTVCSVWSLKSYFYRIVDLRFIFAQDNATIIRPTKLSVYAKNTAARTFNGGLPSEASIIFI